MYQKNTKRGAGLPSTKQKVQLQHHKGYDISITRYLPFVNLKRRVFLCESS
nr:MAG TPA: hypothetical protein [Caudoviricetes sp.]